MQQVSAPPPHNVIQLCTRFIDSDIKRHDSPILIAVSCRSPVNTHTYIRAPSGTAVAEIVKSVRTLIPAICIVWIASGTPSCSLSSIAVAPRRNMSFSRISAALSSASPRPLIVAAAWSYMPDHVRYSVSGISRDAIHNVRKPSVA